MARLAGQPLVDERHCVPVPVVGAEAAVELRYRSQCYFYQDDVSRTARIQVEMKGCDKRRCYVGLDSTQLLVLGFAAEKLESVVVIVAADIG